MWEDLWTYVNRVKDCTKKGRPHDGQAGGQAGENADAVGSSLLLMPSFGSSYTETTVAAILSISSPIPESLRSPTPTLTPPREPAE